jgi:hypothetical protein
MDVMAGTRWLSPRKRGPLRHMLMGLSLSMFHTLMTELHDPLEVGRRGR